MNKKLLVVMAMLLLLCTGCTKKLTCTKSHDDSETVSGTEKYVFSFDKDNMSTSARISLEMDYDDSEYDKDELKEMAETLEDSYKNDYGYKDVSVKVSGKKVYIKFTMEIDKDDAKSYDEVKERYEDDDYKCK